VTRASREAIQSIEGKGGKVTTVYYNKLSMKYLFNPEQFGTTRRIPRAALPVRRYLIGIPYLEHSFLTCRLLYEPSQARLSVLPRR
jgi:hypothetical protein